MTVLVAMHGLHWHKKSKTKVVSVMHRHMKHSMNHSPKAPMTRAISSFRQSTNLFTYQNHQAKLVSQALSMQSAEFAMKCQEFVTAATEHAKLCGAQGCWCKAQSAQTGYFPLACKLEHAFEVLIGIFDNRTKSQVRQYIEHLRSFGDYDNFSTDLAMNRYNKNGLLTTFSGSSFRTADTCYQCTEPVCGKATTKQKSPSVTPQRRDCPSYFTQKSSFNSHNQIPVQTQALRS